MKQSGHAARDSKLPVFVSYSHADTEWLARLSVHLKVLEREYRLDKWDDRRIAAGTKWRDEIRDAISRCRIAILLISADFLASDFIHHNELPPLLQAAEEKGTRIIPIVVGPCLFGKKQEISQFQSINPPSRPLISMTKAEQEETFLQVAERLFDLIGELNSESPDVSEGEKQVGPGDWGENFLLPSTASKLIKIGDWIHDSENRQIIGAGVGSFLLSREAYGGNFHVHTTLSFSNFTDRSKFSIDGFNAGIVLGWNDTPSGKRYFNVLITGASLLVERIGFDSGDDFDFEHLCEPVDFKVSPGALVDISVEASEENLIVSNGKSVVLTIPRPLGISGRVGLRPWRSQMNCKDFVVRPAK